VLQAKSGGAHPATMAVWQRARVLSRSESDLSGAALIRYHLSSGHMSAGNYAEALTLAAELREIQERLRHPVFEVACHQVRSLPLLYLGRLPESLAGLDAACAVDADSFQTHQLGVEQPVLLRWGFAAWAQWLAGFPDRSRESAERGRDHARRYGNPYGLCYLSAWSAVAALFRRDWSEARRLGLEASQLAGKQGYTMLAAVGVFAEATAAVKVDGEEAALERYAGAVAQAGSTGNRCASTAILGNLADVLLALDRRDEAARHLKGALALSHAIDERFYLAELLRLRGEIGLRRAGPDRGTAEAAFREAIGIARGQAAKSLELRAATSLARLWQAQGKPDAARDLLAPVYAWFSEGFDTLDLIEAKALLEELGA
jgi:tetratricopeptide (TPR) repeat protein